MGRQLRKPEGELGKSVAEKMNITNKAMTMAAYDALDLQQGQSVMEIGVGNAGLVPYLLEKIGLKGQFVGLDFSADMACIAQSFLQAEGFQTMSEVHCCSSDALPFQDELLDAAVSVNTIYFWERPLDHLLEIKRVLKSRGKFSLAVRGKDYMLALPFGKDGFVFRDEQTYRNLLNEAGFELIKEIQFIDEQNGDIKVDEPAVVCIFLCEKS